MTSSIRTNRRRATILLMVVSILALLFILVSGYLTLARSERTTVAMVQRGAETDEIIKSINNVVISQMRAGWADAYGNLLTGGLEPKPSAPTQAQVRDGYSYEDCPGERGTAWLASNELVYADDARYDAPASVAVSKYKHAWRVVYSALSSITPGVGRSPASVGLLLRENPYDDDNAGNGTSEFFVDINSKTNELELNGRFPFMDADGDGVSDASALGSAVAVEIANAMAGHSVLAPRDPTNPQNPNPLNSIPRLDPGNGKYFDELYNRYDQQARYEAAARVISHGGMIALQSPSASPWNRQFANSMFLWARHQDDNGGLGTLPGYSEDEVYDALYANSTAIEPLLRRRGGLLPSFAPSGDATESRVPAILRLVQSSFEKTFIPSLIKGDGNPGKLDYWQRFNLANPRTSLDEMTAWQLAASLPAAQINDDIENNRNSLRLRAYARRQLITTVSNSDELARKQGPDPSPPGVANPARGIYPGQLKFFLGELSDQTQLYLYNTGTQRWVYNRKRGNVLIPRLAGYFEDMLRGHADWTGEPAKRRQQAMMLAVNTVAFAMPRTLNGQDAGFVDVVSYKETSPDPTTNLVNEYIGWGPQPVLTEVVAFNETDPPAGGGGPPADEDVALCVEIYNPGDPGSGGKDPYALLLRQFAVSINRNSPNDSPSAEGNVWKRLDQTVFPNAGANPRLLGRGFTGFAIDDLGSNTVFNGPMDNRKISNLAVKRGGNDRVTVNLWRSDLQNPTNATPLERWYLVDQITIDYPKGKRWTRTFRDTLRYSQLGNDNGALPDARWATIVATHDDSQKRYEQEGPEPTRPVKVGDASPTAPPNAGAPQTPLVTMNAPPFNDLNINGALRPRNFPTVGFMLFVPRFTHTQSYDATGAIVVKRRPLSDLLYETWNRYESAGKTVPADFGHMPIFDNDQTADADGYFADSRVGRIPWGQLVFDYFTTINPDGPDLTPGTSDDLDPYRVPGRININSAPWFVLAGLPIIGPNASGPRVGELPLDRAASPTFWDPRLGGLVGRGADGTLRHLVYDRASGAIRSRAGIDTEPYRDTVAGVYRLGTYLAQSLVMYRDGVNLMTIDRGDPNPGATRFWDAAFRNRPPMNDPSGPGDPYDEPMPYRGLQYDKVRGQPGLPPPGSMPVPTQAGFLTLGELANVKGFDSTEYRFETNDRKSGRTRPYPVGAVPGSDPLQNDIAVSGQLSPDFIKAVSLLALIDSHFLTTRSNTYTVYVSLMDRVQPQRSVRSQLTVDRSNLLPRLLLDRDDLDRDGDRTEPLLEDPDGPGGLPPQPIVVQSSGLPEIMASRQSGYFNAQFED
jgi:hypothetical protein